MQALAPRFIDAAEAHRLRVVSGWYGSKANGTFVTGPHQTEEECARTLAARKKETPSAPFRRDDPSPAPIGTG